MQFSESWLRSWVNPKITSDELSHLLTMAGLEVEEITPVLLPFNNILVGLVVSTTKHPNIDCLHICQVDVGFETMLNIACNAPNVRPGIKVPCAIVSATLAFSENSKLCKIKLGQLCGIESQGTLCSAYELKLSKERSGLLELPEDVPVGQNFRDYYALNNFTFTINLTPNKADCLSVLGVAREVSALTNTPLKKLVFKTVPVTITETLPVKISAPDLCGRFSGRIIRGLSAKAKTPYWMKHRLEQSGQNSISALVDISNYVMLELGCPTHVFDLDKIRGGLDVRWGKPGESLKLLNGNTISIDDWIGVISDDRQIESLAGIMGGAATAVSLETQNIYLEAAFWWPQAIQGRARRYNCLTGAAHRFERGVDFETTVENIERITSLLIEICGTSQTQVGPVDDQSVNLPKRDPVRIRTARVIRVIGVPFLDSQIADIFTRLGLAFIQERGIFFVTPPSYRFDIEIEEDLIEEIARIYGFENIPALPPVTPNTMYVIPENQRSLFTIRQQLANLDYQEVINFSFVEEALEIDCADNMKPIKLLNPITSQIGVMRSTLAGGLIINLKYNLNRKMNRVRIFETGAIYIRDQEVQNNKLTKFTEPKRLAGLAYGPQVDEQWGQASRIIDFFDVKADLEALFSPATLRFRKIKHPALHPGCSAQVLLDEQVVGFIGQLNPRLQQKYELPFVPVLFEVDSLALQKRKVPASSEISLFPTVVRDLSVVVKREVYAQDLLDVFFAEQQQNSACRILQTIVLFDEYHGMGLENDEKNLAFHFILQNTENTLRDDAVEAAMSALIAAINRVPTAKLRT